MTPAPSSTQLQVRDHPSGGALIILIGREAPPGVQWYVVRWESVERITAGVSEPEATTRHRCHHDRLIIPLFLMGETGRVGMLRGSHGEQEGQKTSPAEKRVCAWMDHGSELKHGGRVMMEKQRTGE